MIMRSMMCSSGNICLYEYPRLISASRGVNHVSDYVLSVLCCIYLSQITTTPTDYLHYIRPHHALSGSTPISPES